MSTSSRHLVQNNGVIGEMGRRTGVRGVGRLRGEEDDESDISLGDGVGGRDFTGETTVLQDSKSDSDITRVLAEARVTTIYFMREEMSVKRNKKIANTDMLLSVLSFCFSFISKLSGER